MAMGTSLFAVLIGLDLFLWYHVAAGGPPDETVLRFLDVGQGDSTLFTFPGGVVVMTDAGPLGSAVRPLERSKALERRYIDVAVVSHPQLDHYGGFLGLLDRYRFGAFLINGRSNKETPEWEEFVALLEKKRIPAIVVGASDRVRHGDNRIDILSPVEEWQRSAELNDTGLVMRLNADSLRALLAADIGANVEEYLVRRGVDLRADVLKVGHHGSKYSSGDAFLSAVSPKVAVIGVGAGNRYGHPAPETLKRLSSSTDARVFRTDRNGTVTVKAEGGTLRIFTER